MKTLLVIDASGRVTRSITRSLTDRFTAVWSKANPDGKVIRRDVGSNPPPSVNESWIAAVFSDPATHTDTMRSALAPSDALLEEIEQAEAIVIGTPIYNFGMPAQLKAWFDQIVRMGRSFDIRQELPDPYIALLDPKPVTVIISAGDGSMHPGGALYPVNFLEPHVAHLLRFVGMKDISFVRVGYEEYNDDRFRTQLEDAKRAVEVLAVRGIEPATPEPVVFAPEPAR
jgi:FMN-dependent NADH-azoreductase